MHLTARTVFIVCIVSICKVTISQECSACRNRVCRKVRGIFSKASLPVGYNMIARVPPQSCNITVTEVTPSSNFLAIRSKNGYIINGNWAVLPGGRYMGAGTGFIYTHSTRQQGETIFSAGPNTEFIDIMVIYHSFNPGISYEYWHPMYLNEMPSVSFLQRSPGFSVQIPQSITSPIQNTRRVRPGRRGQRKKPNRRRQNKMRHRQKFFHAANKPAFISKPGFTRGDGRSSASWTMWKLTKCSKSCGGGEQKTAYICTAMNGNVLADNFCQQPKPPSQTVECNMEPCPPMWVLDDWTPCSVTCGTGQRVRNWSCVQEVSPTVTRNLPPSMCSNFNQASRNPVTQLCSMAPCTRWEVSSWTKCSVECGTGFQTRDVICQADGVALPNAQCNKQEKPPIKQLCHGLLCSQNTWFFTDWSDECFGGCDKGVHRRKVWCAPSVNSIQGRCSQDNRPSHEKPCTNLLTCSAAWFTGPWTTCSSDCGNGTRTREVVCVIYLKGTFRATLDIECDNRNKPKDFEMCNTDICPPHWYYTDWSDCSKVCGRGSQSRAVQCLDAMQKPSLGCIMGERPDITRTCNTKPCSVNKDSNCSDDFEHCAFVLRARLCKYFFYKKLCCASCS